VLLPSTVLKALVSFFMLHHIQSLEFAQLLKIFLILTERSLERCRTIITRWDLKTQASASESEISSASQSAQPGTA